MNEKKYQRQCSVCNIEFYCAKPKGKFCSNRCRNADWRDKNRELYREKQANWIKENPDRHRHNQSTYSKNRCRTDINFLLRRRTRARLGRIKFNKGTRTVDLLGCSITAVKKHLESQFQPGMSWDNYGQWHIDHIRPLSLFNLIDAEEFAKACHYTNLQPLWAKDNLAKGDKYEQE